MADEKFSVQMQKANWKRRLLSPVMIPAVNKVLVPLIKRLPGADWKFRLPALDVVAATKLPNGTSVKMANAQICAVARELFWHNGHMKRRADTIAFETACRLSTKSENFLDIGAYTGLFALGAVGSNPEIQAHTYEIFPQCYALAKDNVVLNQFENQISLHLIGVSNETGTITMPKQTEMTQLPSSFSLGWEFEDGETVPLDTLDNLHSDMSGPTTIKIDVEGFELPVFTGGQAFLRRNKPDIICEVLTSAPNIAEMQALLQELGYDFYSFTDHGISPANEIVPDKWLRDWLFTQRSQEELKTLGIEVAR